MSGPFRSFCSSLLVTAFLFASASPARAVECLVEDFAATPAFWPDYAASNPTVLASCAGTNHQTIDALDRVVFLGDSLAVGTPPSTSTQFFRSILADQLVAQYGLAAPSILWKSVDALNGTTIIQDSGDFSSCARWGARAKDLLAGDMQIASCFPAPSLSERTLVVIAVGANDFSVLATEAAGGATPAELQTSIDDSMASLRATVDWLVTPGRLPNGVFVVIANPLDFTDGSGDVSTCPGAAAAGINDDYTPVLDLIAGANEEILST